MEVVSTNELQQKLTTLRRAPPPKAPVPSKDHEKPQEGELFKVKLKSTKPAPEPNKDKPAETTESEDNANNNSEVKARSSSVKVRSQIFENGSPGKPPVLGKPAVASKKPVIGAKPTVPSKPPVNANSNQNTGVTRARPPSVINKPDHKIVDSNKDARIPELKPLPPVFALGDPPQKSPKFGLLKQSLKKYLGTSYPPRPVVSEKNNNTSPPAVQDAPPIPKKPTRPGSGKQSEDVITTESITEDFYDDTACSASNDATEEFYDDTTCANSNAPEPSEDIYDDTVCADDLKSGVQDETFGEDIYEPILGTQEEQRKESPAEKAPPTLPAKDNGKEDKKKKEKERKRKEKEDKEEKEREERERKKREKERERKVSDMKRRFSVKGSEKSLGTCIAAEDIAGNKMDIAASIGEEFDIIRKGKPIPNNKWLVRNKQGLYGFIEINKIEKEPADDGEDLYEEVPASKMRITQSNGNHIPTPPVTSPPPPPTQNAPRPPADDQEIYDDVAGQDAEELYELLPEN